ncbi:MAG: hypothetical protein AB1540_16185 [Bdellovibrionota bacterium]
MLRDWLWSFAIASTIWLEAAGLSLLIKHLFARKFKDKPLHALALLAVSFALLSQFYFIASLVGLTGGLFHFSISAALSGFFILRSIKGLRQSDRQEPLAGLKLARLYSPLYWSHAWPWLALPLTWFLLRLIDATVPHSHTRPLAVHLHSAHQWFEHGSHYLDALYPIGGLASIWDGLYFHVQALTHHLGFTHRQALVRAQLVSQLIHFSAGQCIALLALAHWISPLVRAGWETLMHAMDSLTPLAIKRRHQVGMASSVAVPSSIFFAWLACAQPAVHSTGILASQEWAAVAFTATAILALESRAHFLAGLLLGTATACLPSSIVLLPAISLYFVPAFDQYPRKYFPFKPLFQFIAAFFTATLPWVYRNLVFAGSAFFPWDDAHRAQWFMNAPQIFVTGTYLISDLAPKLILIAGGVCLITLVGVKKILNQTLRKRLLKLSLFLILTLLSCLIVTKHPKAHTAVMVAPILALLLSTIALEMLFTGTFLRIPFFLVRALPYFWFVVGLFVVPLPFHVIWQHGSLALEPADTYLLQNHRYFGAKLWSSTHLPRTERLGWIADQQPYYLEQQSFNLSTSKLLSENLAKASNPRERARILCELKFSVFAWEERFTAPEIVGLVSWLKVIEAPVLYSSEEVTLFDLKPACISALEDKP